MYVEVQLDKGGFSVASVEDEREHAMFVRFLEMNTTDNLYSFKSPVWISKGKIVTNCSSLCKLGYEQVGINLYREVEITSDEDYVPEEDDEDEDEEEHLN